MQFNDIVRRMDEIKPKLIELAEHDGDLPEERQTEWQELRDEWSDLEASAKRIEARQADVEHIRSFEYKATEDAPDFGEHTEREKRGSNPWDLESLTRATGGEVLARAVSAVEETPGATDKAKNYLTNLVERMADEDNDSVARLVLATTSPAYKRAFSKMFKYGEAAGLARLSDEEKVAVRFAEQVRAVTVGTDGQGGYLVPTDIEPVVTLADDGTNNPIYDLARRVQTTSDTYRVVNSTGATWSWDSEAAEVSDDTPTYTNTDISLYTGRGFVPVSIEATASIQSAAQNINMALMDGWNDLVGAALTTGSGSQPQGIVTALTGGSSEISSATTDTFAVADVYALYEALPARHRRNATWMGNIAAIADIRQFATDDGHALLARLGEGPVERLLGRPLVENEDMDSSITALGENYYLIFGDFRHFVVAEGIGTTIEFIPHVFGSNGRPIGARGYFAYHRFGSDSVLDGAFRMLNVT